MTVVYEIGPSSASDEAGWFHQVGTTPPTVGLGPRKFMAGIFVAACAATSTLGAVTPADALALNAIAAHPSTLPATAAQRTSLSDGEGVSVVLQRLRRVSGLSWEEVGRAVGVSRRTIHNWLGGARLAGVHLTRLLEFSRAVDLVSKGSPESTRAMLLQPRAGTGRSLLDDLALTARPSRRRALSSISVGDLVTPVEETESVSSGEPRRSSSIRGGALPTKRSGMS